MELGNLTRPCLPGTKIMGHFAERDVRVFTLWLATTPISVPGCFMLSSG
jgi:hypothetical protein